MQCIHHITISIVICAVLSVLSCLSPISECAASGKEHVTNVMVLQGGQCPSEEERERLRNKIHQITNSVIASMTIGLHSCNGSPGWRRVAFINMTNTSHSCPTGLNLTSYSKRTCGRSHTTHGGCSSTTFNVGGLPYSSVCGRIRGYQFGATSAFYYADQSIDGYYVDGVSLTHGRGCAGERQHIWTFAAGLAEATGLYPNERCPCDMSRDYLVPSFVGNSYFCESGLNSAWINRQFIFYPNDVLWDGQNCIANSTCCQLNNPPWFTKYLPETTTDDIELRICTSYWPSIDDIPLELIEIYVK